MNSVAPVATQKLQKSLITPTVEPYITNFSAPNTNTNCSATVATIVGSSKLCSLPTCSPQSSKNISSQVRPLQVPLSATEAGITRSTKTKTPKASITFNTTHMLKNVDSCANRPANEAEGDDCHTAGDQLHADAVEPEPEPADNGLTRGKRRVSLKANLNTDSDSASTLTAIATSSKNSKNPTANTNTDLNCLNQSGELVIPQHTSTTDLNNSSITSGVVTFDSSTVTDKNIAVVDINNTTEILTGTTKGNSEQQQQQQQQQQTNDTVCSGDLVSGSNFTTSAAETIVRQRESVEPDRSKENNSNSSSVTNIINTTSESNRSQDHSPVQLRHSSSHATYDVGSKSVTGTAAVSSLSVSGDRRTDEDSVSKSSDTSGELSRVVLSSQDLLFTFVNTNIERSSKTISTTRLSERAKKKSWYNVLYPNYKSRSQDFKKLFRDLPCDERLIVDYSCALQRDILVQGRLYVSQNYVCFHANIFGWETYVDIRWKDVTSITKEKTALVIPNAISICTATEKYFFATFTSRDKSFLMLFRVWQNTLMKKQMPAQELWQWVHKCYGDELGLTTDDEDYIDPSCVPATETETDIEFSSALDDISSLSSAGGRRGGGGTVVQKVQTADVNSIQQGQGDTNKRNKNNSSSGSTSTSSGGGGGSGSGAPASSGNTSGAKSKTKTYFFSTSKYNSANSASGSDNNNRSSSHNNTNSNTNKNRTSNTRSSATMKVNAKELTLESAKPPNSGVGQQQHHGDSVITSKDVKNSTIASSVNTGGGYADGNKRKVPATKHSRQRDESASKNSELSPTDMSDSSDSDENKPPFVATAECTSTHEGRQLMHTILPINIDTLFNLLFTKSKFLVDFHDMRKSTDTNFGEWATNDDGQQQRIVNVTVQLAASVGPKTSKVTEVQVMRECSKPSELYSIDINSVNAGIPYADSFSVLMHYCLVRTVDDHTMLSVHAQIKYKKSIWGVVKGFIEKNTWAGLEDFFTSLLHSLQSETCIPPAKGKGRRPRRGTASQIRPLEEISAIPQSKVEASEKAPAANTLIHAHHQPVKPKPNANGMNVIEGNTQNGVVRSKCLSVFVIFILCFLIALNGILLAKLWRLEERIEDDMTSRARMPNLSALKQLPNTHQEWIELLRQQEILHETELKKWHVVLQTAIELLKKTERTLAALMFR